MRGGEPELEEEECRFVVNERAVDGCAVQKQCTRPLAEDSDFAAILSTEVVQCSFRSPDSLFCYCGANDYLVKDTDGFGACDSVLELCTRPQFDELVCREAWEQVYENSCTLGVECLQTREFEDGAFVGRVDNRQLSCREQAAGKTRCSCDPPYDEYTFVTSDPARSTATCRAALERCQPEWER